MKQLNIPITKDFEATLKKYMRLSGMDKKSKAIRLATEQALKQLEESQSKKTDFRSWLGAGLKAPLNPTPKFKNDNDLW